MDLHEIATEIAEAGDAGLHLRQGVVSAIAADGTLTVTIAGSSKSISGVRALNAAMPAVGAAVWLAVDGPLILAIGSVYPGGRFSVYATGTTTLPAGTWTTLALAGSTYTDGNYAANTYTCPVAGRYLFCGGINVQFGGTSGAFLLSVWVGGTETKRFAQAGCAANVWAGNSGSCVLSLAAGATVELRAFPNAAATAQSGAEQSWFMGQLLP